MIKSMTAFASKEAELDNMVISCELRSVNHRYCDISIKLPERWRFMEAQLRTAMSAVLNRGKIECNLSYKRSALTRQNFQVNTDALEALLAATATIEAYLPAALSFSALEVLAFPGIQQEQEADQQELAKTVEELIRQTLQELLKVREREGAQLKVLIEERCIKMQGFIEQAALRIPEVLSALRRKIVDRVNELVLEPNFDRLEQELVFLTQKLDITEELDRLNTHVTEVLRTLQQPDPIGRRLDFLMQELNREANTLGSKSADKEMTQISIELKVLIEQMREQIQNIE